MIITREELFMYVNSILDSISYEENVFSIYRGKQVLIGTIVDTIPEAQDFFNYATIYNSIIDINNKIRYSIKTSIQFADELDTNRWDPLEPPSKEELTATYYVENAIFRIEILWDLLAQLSNIKYRINKPVDKIYSEKFFKDLKKHTEASEFATRVCAYMHLETVNDSDEQGDYAFVREYRHKMTHRFSPNITSISNYALEVRLPVVVLIKKITNEYKQVSLFIKDILADILKDYKDPNPKTIWITRR